MVIGDIIEPIKDPNLFEEEDEKKKRKKSKPKKSQHDLFKETTKDHSCDEKFDLKKTINELAKSSNATKLNKDK